MRARIERRATSRRAIAGRLAAGLSGLALAACTAAVVSARTPFAESTRHDLDLALARAGLGIEEVRLSGHRHTPDNDIFAALIAGSARSVPLLDATAARRRIEALPWIETARIARVLPDRVEVVVVERRPVAVWHDGARHVLVDATGRELAQVRADTVPDLLRIAGAGAAQAAARLSAAVALHPGIASRLVVATRVGERRWSLVLTGGSIVHLPESGLDAALQHLADLDARGGRGGGAPLLVDLRRDGLVAVRPAAGAPGRAGGTPAPRS